MTLETVCTAAICPNTVAWELIKGIPTAFATFVIGSIAAYIAFRQYRVAHAKFKLDLFEKRYAIYLKTVEMISRIAMGRPLNSLEGAKFRGQTADAPFLFDSGIATFIHDISVKADMSNEERKDHEDWATENLETVADRFMPYMDMRDWR
ncbi:hypothetical protein [Burkholderia cenocepacia]|uniref:hypothetical protein n=1 Tax=Burkholderia cenocepacia TaxID=95486 RepID=UPI002AB5DF18|nr:hypothetical protein [Burkholderia cenocepacia]